MAGAFTACVGVTGAFGWIGWHACAALERAGVTVRRLGRVETGLDLARARVADWVGVLHGCTTVVHCAAHVHRPRESAEENERFRSVNVEGTARLLKACQQAQVQKVVFASSMAVYAWGGEGGARRESDRLAPDSAYGRSKLDGETLFRESGLSWRIARLATVYGTGDRANFMRLARALRRRRFLLPGAGAARKSVLPVELAGELLCRLALLRADGPITVNCAAPSAPSLAEICAAFAETCGFPLPLRVPLPLMRLGAQCGDLAEFLHLPSPYTTGVLRKLTTDTVVDVTRMQSLFPDLAWQEFEPALVRYARYYRGYGT